MNPRLLVIERHHLGDAVIALPFLRVACVHRETHVFCKPGVAAFLAAAAPQARITACPEWRDVFRQLPRLGAEDAAVCAWPDTRAHLAMRQSGAGTRIGPRVAAGNFYGAAQPWRRRRLLLGRLAGRLLGLTGSLLTRPLDRAPQGQTHGQNWTQIARALGWEPDFSFPWLPVSPAPQPFQAFVTSCRTAGKRVVAVHAGGRLATKRWPIENFETLLGKFFPQNRMAVALIAAPGEPCPRPRADDQRVFESPDPIGLAAIFAGADGALCNDSFAAHLAAAVGLPTVTIFGSGDPAWFAPFANAHLAVATDACPHRPCVDRCVQPSFLCLESVSIRLVEEKLSAMFPHAFGKSPT